MGTRVDVLYSPLCEKIPFIRQIAEKYALELYEYNIFDLNENSVGVPGFVAEKMKEIHMGNDGFYAWYVFVDGKSAPDFEDRFPTDFILETEEVSGSILPEFTAEELSVCLIDHDFFTSEQKGPGTLCLGCLTDQRLERENSFTEIRRQRRSFAEEVIMAHGTFGIALRREQQVIGFLTYMPKNLARRVGFYGGRIDEPAVNTLTVGCLFIPKPYRSKGIAKRLLREMIKWAKDAGYSYIEAVVKEKDYGWDCEWWSIHPFGKVGFKKIRPLRYDDGYPNMWLVGLELVEDDGS